MGKRSREKKERREKIERGETTFQKEESKKGLASLCFNVIRLGTYLILFTPFIISPRFFFPFVGPKSIYFFALVEIIFIAWLFLIFLKPKYRPRLNVLLIILLLFVAVLIISSVLGVDFSRSFWSKYERMTGLLMWFHLLAFFVVLFSTFQKKEDWHWIFIGSVFASILMSIIAIISLAGIEILGEMTDISRKGATIGNSSSLGTYLLFNIFLALYLFFEIKNSGIKIFSICGALLGILTIYLISARAATLSVLGGLILLFFLWFIFTKKGILRFVGIFLLFLVIVGTACLIYLSLQEGSIVYEKIGQLASKSRYIVWKGAWQGFLERPWLGWGLENFELVFTKYFDPRLFLSEYGGEIWFDRVHNILLDTLIASGILGLITYLGLFLSVFYILWRNYFEQKINFWTVGIIFVLLVAYFVQNLTTFDMINSYMMFFLILGFVASISIKEQVATQRNNSSFHPLVGIVILVLFLVSFLNFVIKPIQADANVINALKAQSGTEERVALCKKTLKLSPLGKYQIRERFADAAIEAMPSGGPKTTEIENFKKELNFVSEELEKTIQESPLDYKAHLKLGQIYNVYGLFDQSKFSRAEEILEKAIEISPTNQQGYWALAQTRIYQGRFEDAISLAEKAVELEKRVKRSHLVLIEAAKIVGKRDLAEQKAKEALEINPSWEPEIREILAI